MKRYKPFNFNEARRNPEQNPHISAWDYVDKYKDDKDVYISFTEIDKIGINPKSKFNTPVGIYTYPLREFVKNYTPFMNLSKGFESSESKNIYTKSVGSYAPFAGSAKYISFIRVKDKSHFIEDMYKDYGSDKYDRDIKILEKKYKEIMFKEYKTEKAIRHIRKYFDVQIFDNEKELWLEFIDYSLKEAKEKNPSVSMWNITRLLSDFLSADSKQSSTKWNLILSKDLGYSGFADKSGKGYIHPSEPMQAVFFNTRAFEVITRVDNVPAKKTINIHDPKQKIEYNIKNLGLENKDYIINMDLTVDFEGYVDIGNKHLKEIPFKFGTVDGHFACHMNNLTSLKNSPDTVGDDFICDRNPQLKSLEGLPKFIGGDLTVEYSMAKIYSEDDIRKMSNIKGKVEFGFGGVPYQYIPTKDKK